MDVIRVVRGYSCSRTVQVAPVQTGNISVQKTQSAWRNLKMGVEFSVEKRALSVDCFSKRLAEP